MGRDEKIEGAKRVLAWIKRTAKNTFSVRDCQQALKQQAMFNHVQPNKEALAELEERAFIWENLLPEPETAGNQVWFMK